MSATEIVDGARRQQTPRDLERYLDDACGNDMALRDEVMRRLAQADTDAQPHKPTRSYGDSQIRLATSGYPDVQGDEPFIESWALNDIRIGEVLDRKYTIVDEIGRGGMGAVYAANQFSPVVRSVAIKVIKAGLDSAPIIARFEQERQLLALMDHPNIARVLDGGFTRLGRPYFAMELVQGQKLGEFCDEAKLSIRERIELFIPVCRAVQHAHQKGIIHRDLKPSNILVTLVDGKPTPKVIDFGVAKALDPGLTDNTVHTGANTIIGTIEYMAPEQATHNNLDVDTRADVYSLGVILYELLCGVQPLSRHEQLTGSMEEMARVIREIEPKRPSTRLSTFNDQETIASRRQVDATRLQRLLRGELDWVVMKCLEKDRDRRYDTAQGLAADLERYLHEEPVQAAPPSNLYRFTKFLRRHSGKVAAAGIGLLLLTGSAVISTIGWLRAIDAERVAREEADLQREWNNLVRDDIFGLIDPAERLGAGLPADADVKLQPLLDRLSDRVNAGQTATKPRLEASLSLALAKAYASLGKTDQALAHAQRADDLRVKHLGATHPDRVESLEVLGVAQHYANQLDAAFLTFEEALKGRERISGPDDPRSLNLRYSLAIIERSQRKTQAADERLQVLIKDQRRVVGPDDPQTLRSERARAELLAGARHFNVAAPMLEDILARWEKVSGPNHPGVLGTMNSLGVTLRQKNLPDDAEKLFVQLLERAGVVYGRDHPLVAVYQHNHALCYVAQGRDQDALDLLRQIRPAFEKIGADHRLTLEMKRTLAHVFAKLKMDQKAKPILLDLLHIHEDKFGRSDERTIKLLLPLAQAHSNLREHAEAIATLNRLLKHQREQSPPDQNEVATTTGMLATEHYYAGHRDQAIDLLKQAIATAPGRADLQEVLKEIQKNPTKP